MVSLVVLWPVRPFYSACFSFFNLIWEWVDVTSCFKEYLSGPILERGISDQQKLETTGRRCPIFWGSEQGSDWSCGVKFWNRFTTAVVPSCSFEMSSSFMSFLWFGPWTCIGILLSSCTGIILYRHHLYNSFKSHWLVCVQVKLSEGRFYEHIDEMICLVGGSETMLTGTDVVIANGPLERMSNVAWETWFFQMRIENWGFLLTIIERSWNIVILPSISWGEAPSLFAVLCRGAESLLRSEVETETLIVLETAKATCFFVAHSLHLIDYGSLFFLLPEMRQALFEYPLIPPAGSLEVDLAKFLLRVTYCKCLG